MVFPFNPGYIVKFGGMRMCTLERRDCGAETPVVYHSWSGRGEYIYVRTISTVTAELACLSWKWNILEAVNVAV